MLWQDIVIMIANLVFVFSLIPQVLAGFRRKRGFINPLTSLPTTIGLLSIAYAFFTLELYFSAVVSLLTASLWFVLFVQRLVYKEKEL